MNYIYFSRAFPESECKDKTILRFMVNTYQVFSMDSVDDQDDFYPVSFPYTY
jgi:hypothetical protein